MLMIKTHSKQPNAYKMTKSTSCTVKQLKKKHIIFSRHNYCISVTKYNRMPLVVTKCLYRKLMQRPRSQTNTVASDPVFYAEIQTMFGTLKTYKTGSFHCKTSCSPEPVSRDVSGLKLS